jgi:gas vesicle protein
MLAGTLVGAVGIVVSLLISPETKGKELEADLVVA